jgi:hypothetical protein
MCCVVLDIWIVRVIDEPQARGVRENDLHTGPAVLSITVPEDDCVEELKCLNGVVDGWLIG